MRVAFNYNDLLSLVIVGQLDCLSVCLSVCMYVCMHVCMYVAQLVRVCSWRLETSGTFGSEVQVHGGPHT